MAKVTANPIKPVELDAWDQISTFTLKLTREEAKVVYTVLGDVVAGESGPAGEAAYRVYAAIDDAAPGLFADNNLYVDGNPNLIIKSK